MCCQAEACCGFVILSSSNFRRLIAFSPQSLTRLTPNGDSVDTEASNNFAAVADFTSLKFRLGLKSKQNRFPYYLVARLLIKRRSVNASGIFSGLKSILSLREQLMALRLRQRQRSIKKF